MEAEKDYKMYDQSIISNSNQKPQTQPVVFDAIPAELKALNQWCLWKYELRDGKWTKVPVQPYPHLPRAKSNDPTTWSTWEAIAEVGPKWQKFRKVDGVGFFTSGEKVGISSDFVGIDVDKCLNNGELTAEARDILDTVQSYSEFSPSGKGLRIFCHGKLPPRTDSRHFKNDKYEIYDATTNRFLTITGHVVCNRPIETRQAEIEAVHRKYILGSKISTEKPNTQAKPNTEAKPNTLAKPNTEPVFGLPHGATLEDVVWLGSQQPKFAKLWEGDTEGYNSQSEADQALCHKLAYYGLSAEQIDECFRRSGLYREKWERTDYRERTLNNATRSVDKVFDWSDWVSDRLVEETVLHGEPTPPKKAKSHLLTLSVLQSRADQLRNSRVWAAEKWIQVGKVGLLSGKAKAGKSTLLFHLASSIITGTKMFDLVETHKMPVLFVDYENEEDYQYDNIGPMIREKQASVEDVDDLLYFVDPQKIDTLCKPLDVEFVVESIEDIKAKTGMEYGVFFLDTARPAFNGLFKEGDWEWKASLVRACSERVREIVKRTGWGGVIIHHHTKASGSPSGSGDWEGSVDYSISYELDKRKWESHITWMGRQTNPPGEIVYTKRGAILEGHYAHEDKEHKAIEVRDMVKGYLSADEKRDHEYVVKCVRNGWLADSTPPGVHKVRLILEELADTGEIDRETVKRTGKKLYSLHRK